MSGLMKDATLSEWSAQCVHYKRQQRMLKENDYAENTRLARRWKWVTLNKIKCLSSNGSHVYRILRMKRYGGWLEE